MEAPPHIAVMLADDAIGSPRKRAKEWSFFPVEPSVAEVVEVVEIVVELAGPAEKTDDGDGGKEEADKGLHLTPLTFRSR